MNIKDLTVVGVVVPKQPQKGDRIIKIYPKLDYLSLFQGKDIYFAETELSVDEFISYFINPTVSGHRVAEYVKTLNSNLIFKNQLFNGSGIKCNNIFYDPIYKRALNLENVLGNGDLCPDRENHLRAQILYAKSFEQGQYLIDNAEFDTAKDKVLYVNFPAGYAIHLLKGCKFMEDVSVRVDIQKMKKDLALIHKAYKLNSIWEWDQTPNIIGAWAPKKEFKLFSFTDKEDTKKVTGFISDQVGLQYFEGRINDREEMRINSKYFLQRNTAPLDWGKISCFTEREIIFPLKNKKGRFFSEKGEKVSFRFEKVL